MTTWRPFTQMKLRKEFPKVIRGDGVFLELENGKKVIDAISSWWVTLFGHAEPTIARAISKQAQTLEHVIFPNFSHEPAEKLMESLLPLLPENLMHGFFSDDGSTSVEVALKMAIAYWENKKSPRHAFLSFEGAYHGDTLGAMSVSARSTFTSPYKDLLFDTTYLPYPYIGDGKVEEREEMTLSLLENLLKKESEKYAALIIEPLVQGAGGMRMCRIEFLQRLETLLQKYEILCIYDEVMTGFGRTGEFFACIKAGTHPDFICLSKGLTGGFLPLALTVTSDKIYQAFYSDDWQKAFFHGHSYTANPLGCAAAVASLQLLQEKKELFQTMEKKHRLFSKPLLSHPLVSNLRILGTICAFELKSKEQTGYFNLAGRNLQKTLFEKGIFIRPLGNTIYVLPPYRITDLQLKQIYQEILEAL